MRNSVEIPLHFAAEFALAVETDSYPKTDNSSIQLRGPLDEDKFAAAFREAIQPYPLTNSVIQQKRVGLGYRLFWAQQDRPNELEIHDCRSRFASGSDPVDFVQDYFAESTVRRINLFEEFPLRFFLLRLENERYVFSVRYHHISMDAAVGYDLFKDLFARYHEKITGKAPVWGAVNAIGSQLGRNEAAPRQPAWDFMKEQISDLYASPRKKVSQIKTGGTRDLLGRYCHRAVFDSKSIVPGMKAVARRNNATMGDVIAATISRSIAGWDDDHGATTDKIRALLAVNIRGRLPEDESRGVALSGLMINTQRPDRMSIDEVVRHFRERRIHQLLVGTDVAYHKMLEVLASKTHALPFFIRSHVARLSLTVPVTFILSNIGVMWPEVVNGKLTGRTAIDRVGNVVVDDVHSCPSMSPVVGMGIITRTLGDSLFINYSSDRFRFTKDEAKAVTDRITGDIAALAAEAESLETRAAS